MDSTREIAANKLCALLGRREPRDLVDIFALFAHGHALPSSLADARVKDAGLEPGTLSWVLSEWKLGPATPLPEGVTLEQVESMRSELIERLLVLAVPPA